MVVSAVLMVDQRGQSIPLARTRNPTVLRTVADTVLGDLQAATAAERDEVLAALLCQEVARLRQALKVLGLAQVEEECW